jgi:hypothetical protein
MTRQELLHLGRFANLAIVSHCASVIYTCAVVCDGQREPFSVALDQFVFNAYILMANVALAEIRPGAATRHRAEFKDSNGNYDGIILQIR